MGQAREPKESEEKARRRMSVILQVEAGLMTATAGAQALGISRQAYYEWSNRALSSMADALADRPNGRPAQEADKEKENLAKKLAETKADLGRALLALDIKNTLASLRREADMDRTSGQGAKKNTSTGRKAQKR
jgi:transposase